MINVIGDVALVIAAFLLLDRTGSLDYAVVFESAGEVFTRNDGTLVAAGLLILVGAFAKSAQLPLHSWLPDAMEGPTPVSALIHAATMVTGRRVPDRAPTRSSSSRRSPPTSARSSAPPRSCSPPRSRSW